MKLADPCFYRPQHIDFLISAGPFFDLMCICQIKLGPSLPVLQKTSLGWVVTGRNSQSKYSFNSKIYHINTSIEDESKVDLIVRKFWELEELPTESTQIYSEEHEKCENEFKTSVRRLASLRFVVSLPFKSDAKLLGSSFDTAKRRFRALERRLSKDDTMWQILRPQSITTKLRVVFDASCRTSSHISLNELLMVGPILQEKLYSTLIHFRFHNYIITADIGGMYRPTAVAMNWSFYRLVKAIQNSTLRRFLNYGNL